MDDKEEEEEKGVSVSSPALCSVSPPALCLERGGGRHDSTVTTGNGRDRQTEVISKPLGWAEESLCVCLQGSPPPKPLSAAPCLLLALSSPRFFVLGKQPPPWPPGEDFFNKKRRCPHSHRWREVSWNSSRALSGFYVSSRSCWEPGFGLPSQPTSMKAPFTMCFLWPCFSGSSH